MTHPSREDIGKCVIVHWLDIVQKTVHHCDGVLPAKCKSYGVLERIDDDSVTIITETMDDDYTKQVFPVGCVVKVEVLTA